VAALHGAVAFTEVDYLTVFVAQELELNVAGLLDVLLDVDASITEGLIGLSAGAFEFFRERRSVVDDAHALSSAAGDGFDDDREADALGFLDGFALVVDRSVGAWYARHLGSSGRLRATALSPILRMTSGLGPMNLILAAAHFSAKPARSERKP